MLQLGNIRFCKCCNNLLFSSFFNTSRRKPVTIPTIASVNKEGLFSFHSVHSFVNSCIILLRKGFFLIVFMGIKSLVRSSLITFSFIGFKSFSLKSFPLKLLFIRSPRIITVQLSSSTCRYIYPMYNKIESFP
ncbi:hypothetical protein BLGI_4663 [Brevibacillus laterosporus GI-9]|nr:hypothetical protein BLGI_4663 [Brevibacillus laterosporus GI-9]